MKKLATCVAVLALLVVWTVPTLAAPKGKKEGKAGGGKKAEDGGAKVSLTEIVVTGQIQKKESTRKGKEGEEKTVTRYVLVDADGNSVALPAGKGGDIDLAKYEGKTVTVTGMGTEKALPGKDGGEERKQVAIRKITDIAEAGAAEDDEPAEEEDME